MSKKYDNNLNEIKDNVPIKTFSITSGGVNIKNLGQPVNIDTYEEENKQLKQQLAEYEKKLKQASKTIDNQSSLILQQNEFIKAYNKQLAEKDKEIDELKQEREFMLEETKNRGTCGLCEKLENKEINGLREQLAEKDKEIRELKSIIFDDFNLDASLIEKLTKEKYACDQRHQICEEIREKAVCTKKSYKDYYIISSEILDKIEKGE